MTVSIEDIQDEVERVLRRCPKDVVVRVGTHIKVAVTDEMEERAILRLVQEGLDAVTESDQKLAMFKELIPILPEDGKRKLESVLVSTEERNAADEPNSTVTGEEVNREEKEEKSEDKVPSKESAAAALLKLLSLESVQTSSFRKECRISGSVDENKKVNYISLCKEVSDAKRKGFKAYEIVGAIRKVLPAGELRTYLDSFPDISLEETLILIRSAYKEKSATELFRELDKICQGQSEDGPAFLFRALSLRQRIIKASEVEGEVQYHRPQVVAAFMHSVRTGLRHDSIRNHMVPFLDEKKDPPDSLLMAEINKAQDEFNERMNKQQDVKEKTVKSVKVNEVATASEKLLNQLVEQMHLMSTEMKKMKEDISHVQSKGKAKDNGKSSGSWKRKGCDECTKKGDVENCRHCWKCGGENHQAKHCQKKNSLNDQRLGEEGGP